MSIVLFSFFFFFLPNNTGETQGIDDCCSQVLEWSGVSLIDRSFEEVQQIIERTDDVAELVVEHATDM